MTTITNPLTQRDIKIGGKTHRDLVSKGILERSTLDLNKISVEKDSKQKRTITNIVFYKNTTHFTNINEISRDLNISPWKIVALFSQYFDNFKVCKTKNNILVIFEGYEPYIDSVIEEVIHLKSYGDLQKLDEPFIHKN